MSLVIDQYRKSLDVDPEFLLALVAMADLYQDSGQLDLALEMLERARAVQKANDELNSSMSVRYARLLIKAGRSQAAGKALQEDVELVDQPWALKVLMAELGLDIN